MMTGLYTSTLAESGAVNSNAITPLLATNSIQAKMVHTNPPALASLLFVLEWPSYHPTTHHSLRMYERSKSLMSPVNLFRQTTTIVDFSRLHGCTSMTANTTSHTLPVIHIISYTPLVTRLTDLSPIEDDCWSR